jgi:hypothetical protein
MDRKVNDSSCSLKKESIEIIEGILIGYNLGKDQILLQNISELKQSLININSLVYEFKNDSDITDKSLTNLFLNFDLDYIIFTFVQRKSLIISRYKKLFKQNLLDKLNNLISDLDDSETKDKIKFLVDKLIYVENNLFNISGQLQSLYK